MHASAVMIIAPALVLYGCGSSRLPQPEFAPQPRSAYEAVPYPPPAARVETLPKRPSPDAVWIDGQWAWDGQRWQWVPGAWVLPPAGGRFARWSIALEPDGQLLFAPASWRDANGRELPSARVLATAVGEERIGVMPGKCQ